MTRSLVSSVFALAFVAVPVHAATCERGASDALATCLAAVHQAEGRCYALGGRACDPDDFALTAALDALESDVLASCPDATAVSEAGYGPAMTPDAVADRLAEACVGAPRALGARAFGGPHGAALGDARGAARQCLLDAADVGAQLVEYAFDLARTCVLDEREGAGCDGAAVHSELAAAEGPAADLVADACGRRLERSTGVEPADFVARAAAEARCLVATAHGDPAPLSVDCGPRGAVPVPARATPTQIVLDEATWGTRCGDGSSYAFWVNLAPEGQPVGNVVVHLQGGGVCFFNDDCSGVSPGLFRALDNGLTTSGYMSSTNAASPFRDYTKVYLPYCTQDVHIGGGGTSEFADVTVHRFGGRNVRAALDYVRDVLWAAMDAEDAAGYRPDRLRVILGGGSAGGFGVAYHYHHLLDQLRWTHTVGIPDAALGLPNGKLFGTFGLGFLFRFERGPLGWDAAPLLPSYCHGVPCATVPRLLAAHSERLGDVPGQLLLNVSNQVDTTQVTTTFFDDLVTWMDAARSSYCDNQGLPGVHYFLPAQASSIHTMVQSSAYFPSGITSDGVTLGDWVGGILADPASAADLVEEGTLVEQYGVAPFDCAVD